ncbi:hypothetical protein GS982_01810 [Rhodococcus hoagii]|uniref:Uncharacterized protein n=1 Tax=Rhodococcus hoagii TaxID=43767 RepID=A0A9Q4ZIS3_RHOHA|nr:hypothetical protein [Prescottella equi]NKT77336.1 hypothetical protein [Prescottella equi]NKZ81121.1 hypothetical protein [Prescottella equi]
MKVTEITQNHWHHAGIIDCTLAPDGRDWSEVIPELWADPKIRATIVSYIADMSVRGAVIPIEIEGTEDGRGFSSYRVTDGRLRVAAAHALMLPRVPVNLSPAERN